MYLATLWIFNGFQISEFKTEEEAREWIRQLIKELRSSYPYGTFISKIYKIECVIHTNHDVMG